MRNRFPWFLIPDSVGDKLVAGAYGLQIELLRFPSDDENEPASISCEYKLTGSLPCDDANNPADTLLALLAQFRTPRGEAGVA